MGTKIVELAVKCVEHRVKEPKPIELKKLINEACGLVGDTGMSTKNFDFVTLLTPAMPGRKYDIIVCWSEGEERDKHVFFGHWNDGVVL